MMEGSLHPRVQDGCSYEGQRGFVYRHGKGLSQMGAVSGGWGSSQSFPEVTEGVSLGGCLRAVGGSRVVP